MSELAHNRRDRLLHALLWLAVYFVSGKLGLRFATINPSATPFWPPTGIAIAALLIEGSAAAPVILLGAFVVNITTAGGALSSLGIALGNTAEALVAAYLVRRFQETSRISWKAGTGFALTCAAGAGAIVSASIGVGVLSLSHLAQWTNFEALWVTWWVGDVTGAIIFAPFLIVWFGTPREKLPGNHFETGIFVVTCILLGEIAFSSHSPLAVQNYPIAYLWIPLLVWAGFRFGLRGVTALSAVLCPIAIWQTMHKLGPFTRSDPNTSLLIAQGFTAVLVITGIAIASVVREKSQAEQQLRLAHSSAERLVRERTADLQASNATLKTAQRNLEQLSGHLLTAQDQERRRIARELHDSSGQLLAALGMELGNLSRHAETLSPDADKALKAAIALLNDVTRDIRTVSYLLHPPLLDEYGLLPAVRWYVEGFTKRSRVHVDLNLDENIGRPPAEVETAAFRIIQECLTNIHVHSGSSTARISIALEPTGLLTIQVSDNGKGIRPDALSQPGVGIGGMRERLKILGGDLRIESTKSGSTITATIPIPAEQHLKTAQ